MLLLSFRNTAPTWNRWVSKRIAVLGLISLEGRLKNLKQELEFHWVSRKHLKLYACSRLWQGIGYSLERLVLSETIHPVDEAAGIKQHCRNLKSISRKWDDDDALDAIADLLASYGDQLEYAYLSNTNEVQLKEVADACPIARFRYKDLDDGISLSAMMIIGPRLEVITRTDFEIDREDLLEWESVWDDCMNIWELHIVRCESEVAELIFSTPEELLKIFELYIFL